VRPARPANESAQQSEFFRVASLGTKGRASAVTVLSEAVVRSVRAATDLDADARKFLAFSDNRQDASLQAGHFNDFVLVALVCSVLYRAARDQRSADPDEPLGDENLGPYVVAALGEDPKIFARDEDTAHEPVPRKRIAKALRDVVTYRLWADLKRGWRITMPNLEQTGQLRLSYDGLDDLAANEAKWATFGQPLAGAEPQTRHQLMHVLLDELRRKVGPQTSAEGPSLGPSGAGIRSLWRLPDHAYLCLPELNGCVGDNPCLLADVELKETWDDHGDESDQPIVLLVR
jgi:hypothetical protein